MKKIIKKIIVFSALLTLLGSPAVFATEPNQKQDEGTSATQTQDEGTSATQTQDEGTSATQTQDEGTSPTKAGSSD